MLSDICEVSGYMSWGDWATGFFGFFWGCIEGCGWVPELDKPYRDLGGVLQSLINLKDFLTGQQDVQNLLDWEIRVGAGSV